MLSFFPRDVLDEILNLIESFLGVFFPTLASAPGAGSLLGAQWGNGERLWLAACMGLSFPNICSQRTMTSKGAKKKRPTRTASTAGTCLFVVTVGNASVPKVPRHLHQVNCSRRVIQYVFLKICKSVKPR